VQIFAFILPVFCHKWDSSTGFGFCTGKNPQFHENFCFTNPQSRVILSNAGQIRQRFPAGNRIRRIHGALAMGEFEE